MNRIRRLPLEIANQIAAGEVIERPASIVKELLENALDAKADSIRIEIGHGGLTQITMSDNGEGICAEDLPLSIAAHATSKIEKLQDLWNIQSLGFRGEALASIASIAKVTITSKPEDQEVAAQFSYQDGKSSMTSCARTKGTTIEVLDMFYNAPVRKKFLKSAQIEFQAIESMLKRISLSAMSVAMELYHDEKPVFVLPKALKEEQKKKRIGKIMGKAFLEQAIYLEAEHRGMHLQGFVSGQQYQRSQHDRIWVYVNGRMVKDKFLLHAIKQAYAPYMYPGRFPASILYFEIDPLEVDINVHPTKHEVRFQEARLVHDFFCTQIRKVLETTSCPKEVFPLPPIAEKNYTLAPASAPPSSSSLSSWYPLYTEYAIASLPEPCLVHIPSLYQQFLLQKLQQASFPFEGRPLHVPIYIEKSKKELKELAELGIEVQIEKGLIVLKSIPKLLPHLHITTFLEAYNAKEAYQREALFHLLVAHTPFIPGEEEALLLFLQAHKELCQKTQAVALLTEKHCRELLYA